MTSDEISKMDYKQLRSAVMELNDGYVKLKRALEDALNNLDQSNLAYSVRKELNGYSSQFKIAADKISSKVEHIEQGLEQYSTIEQTADAINMAVHETRDYSDEQKQQLDSSFSMTAEKIATNVSKVNNKTEKYYSEMKQTAEYIRTKVGMVLQRDEFEKNVKPTNKNTTDEEKEKICVFNSTKYYYNLIGEEWLEYDGKIESAFTQDGYGFILNGCVEVQGKINMRENAVIGRYLYLQDTNQNTGGWEQALAIGVNSGTVFIDAKNDRSIYMSCGQFEIATKYGTLKAEKGGLYWNGKKVLTE